MPKHRLNLFQLQALKAAGDLKEGTLDRAGDFPQRRSSAKPKRTAIIRADLLPSVVQAELSSGQLGYRRENGEWRVRCSDRNGVVYLPVGRKWRHICETAYRSALPSGQ